MAREALDEKQRRTRQVVKILKKTYPDAQCSLYYKTPWELLVATILSAQCTDARVNKTTPGLFERFKSVFEMAKADEFEIADLIRSTGFYKNKAKSLKTTAQLLVEKFDGVVPTEMSELTALAGVGRKTANVILGNAFGVPAMVVDTHVTRLSNRLGFVVGKDAVKIEMALEKLVERKDWTIFSHLLIHHGRAICVARSPKCSQCPVETLCPKRI